VPTNSVRLAPLPANNVVSVRRSINPLYHVVALSDDFPGTGCFDKIRAIKVQSIVRLPADLLADRPLSSQTKD
jgi:hypothetical protein